VDSISAAITDSYHDEIEGYQRWRYTGAAEAFWRIFAFDTVGLHKSCSHKGASTTK
jgi:hypothetical protein